MFNYITVDFPNSTASPQRVWNMALYQNRYEHEVAVIQFRDWAINYDAVESGSPIRFSIGKLGRLKEFYGYVSHINVIRSPGSFITEVIAVSGSFVLKNEHQTIYKNLSADALVQKIAKKNNMVAFTVPHERIYPQISQAGHTDWELLVRLAKQSGYSLRTENTEIYFQPVLYEYTNKRSEAIKFIMRDSNHPSGSSIYSFNPTIGENLNFDGEKKAAIAVSGHDLSQKSAIAHTKKKSNKKTRTKSATPFFDKFNTHVVALDSAVAKHEADAAEARATFPYRATAEVIGNPTLRPDLPIYLDGVGDLYNGYWTILGTEHRIVEEERNAQTYTTILHLGTDSLGLADKWSDGKTITAPNATSARTIIPGVRQTNKPAKTGIRTSSINYGPQAKGSFSKTTNRASSSKLSSPVWVSKTASLNPIQVSNKSTSQFSSRTSKIGKIS